MNTPFFWKFSLLLNIATGLFMILHIKFCPYVSLTLSLSFISTTHNNFICHDSWYCSPVQISIFSIPFIKNTHTCPVLITQIMSLCMSQRLNNKLRPAFILLLFVLIFMIFQHEAVCVHAIFAPYLKDIDFLNIFQVSRKFQPQ